MALNEFLLSFEDATKKLESTKGVVRIVSHIDCDGICSASILSCALARKNIKFGLSIIKQVTKEALLELKKEQYDLIIFSDLGSSSKDMILQILCDKQIIILDHHQTQEGKSDNLVEINPLLFGVDGNKEISGAGVCYLFSKLLDEDNRDLSYLAIMGAIGDVQENKGFSGVNSMILNDAKDKLKVISGLRIFGTQTRPIYRVLEYSTEIYIPGVTGSEIGAIKFLEDLGIPIKAKDKVRRLIDLNDEEMKILIEAIVVKRASYVDNPQDIIGPVYLVSSEPDGFPTKDLKEFSTLLNACGRLGKSSLGIGVCLGDKESKKEAFKLLEDYKIEILNGLNWFYDAKKQGRIIEKDYFVIINAEEYIRDTMVGVLASILSRNNVFSSGKVIIAMAHTLYDSTKISSRVAGIKKSELDLKLILDSICQGLGGQGGGHQNAAGAIIPQEKEEEFILRAQEYFSKLSVEQKQV